MKDKRTELFIEYGRNLYMAITNLEIKAKDLNSFEYHAINMYRHEETRTWDEKINDDIQKAMLQPPIPIMFKHDHDINEWLKKREIDLDSTIRDYER